MSRPQLAPQPYGSAEAFDTLVLQSPLPVLLCFECPWSRSLSPALPRLARTFAGFLRVVIVDVAAHPELAARYRIRIVPSLLMLKWGTVVEFLIGPIPHRFLVTRLWPFLGGHSRVRSPSNRGTRRFP